MIDSLVEFEDKFDDSPIIQELDLTKQNYSLITIHRPFTVDNKDRLFEMMDSLVDVSKEIQCVFPIHPRTKNTLIESGAFSEYQEGFSDTESKIKIIEPLGYIDFMCLQKNSKFIITDSGGIQEESSYFNVPCLTVRDNTERPVTIQNGTNKLIGTDYKNLINEVKNINYNSKSDIELWDGRSAQRISSIIRSLYR
jgi:UDP-N-acetylglucosamine 2-epimerase (non-hydrolysing)